LIPAELLVPLCALGGYLVGAIPFGLLLGRLRGIDVRQAGSGNIGAANVARLLGRNWGIAVFVLDTLKGLVAMLASRWVLIGMAGEFSAPCAGFGLSWVFVGACTVLGHNFPVYLRFRGGKGVATSLGVALAVYPSLTIPALFSFGVWGLGVRLTRMSSVGSLAASVAFPVFVGALIWIRGADFATEWPYLSFAIAMPAVIVWRHRSNIQRILAGTEARFGHPR
jgi:glycerol-3-phosphate acyltransferase PlsY